MRGRIGYSLSDVGKGNRVKNAEVIDFNRFLETRMTKLTLPTNRSLRALFFRGYRRNAHWGNDPDARFRVAFTALFKTAFTKSWADF